MRQDLAINLTVFVQLLSNLQCDCIVVCECCIITTQVTDYVFFCGNVQASSTFMICEYLGMIYSACPFQDPPTWPSYHPLIPDSFMPPILAAYSWGILAPLKLHSSLCEFRGVHSGAAEDCIRPRYDAGLYPRRTSFSPSLFSYYGRHMFYPHCNSATIDCDEL